MMTIGKLQAKLSDVVRPPGLVTTNSEMCINSGTWFVKPSIQTFSIFSYLETIASNCCFIFSFFPATAIIE